MSKELREDWKRKRKFSGKTYTYIKTFQTKKEAQESAGRLKKRKFLVRVAVSKKALRDPTTKMATGKYATYKRRTPESM